MFQSTVLSLICAMPIETKMIGMCVCVSVRESVCHKDAPGSHRCWDATFLHQPVVEGKKHQGSSLGWSRGYVSRIFVIS